MPFSYDNISMPFSYENGIMETGPKFTVFADTVKIRFSARGLICQKWVLGWGLT